MLCLSKLLENRLLNPLVYILMKEYSFLARLFFSFMLHLMISVSGVVKRFNLDLFAEEFTFQLIAPKNFIMCRNELFFCRNSVSESSLVLDYWQMKFISLSRYRHQKSHCSDWFVFYSRALWVNLFNLHPLWHVWLTCCLNLQQGAEDGICWVLKLLMLEKYWWEGVL